MLRIPLMRLTSLIALVAIVVTGCGNQSSSSGGTASQQPAQSSTVHISFIYSSEKQAWVEAATKTFNAAQNKISSGKTIYVDTQAAGSGESVSNIVGGVVGHSQPTLWSPASSIWISMLNDQWLSKKGSSLITENCPTAVISPVVIMMWQPMAEALGWPNKDIGWADIAKIASDPKGWADYGNPQWGQFRFGHTRPDYSDSGLLGIMAEVYAATGKFNKLTVDDVNAPTTADFMHNVESAVTHYGSNTGSFGSDMISQDTSYMNAAVGYENVVVSSYNANPRPAIPLVAIYPKEGTFLSDHPLCIPDAPWITADQKEAAQKYRDYLLSHNVQQQALQFGFRPADTSITVGSPIDSAHGADPTQPQNTLAVPDMKVINAALNLWKSQKKQVNLTMLIDVSGSMRDDNKIQGVHDGATAFVDQLDDSDTLTLIAFDDKQYLLFANVNVGQNREQIKQKIAALTPQQGTALYDSIAYAVSTMKIDPKKINALVVLTDGQDTSSATYTPQSDHVVPDSLINLLSGNGAGDSNNSNLVVFTIGYGSDADQIALKKIAEVGRGAYDAANTQDIRQIYLDISTFF